MSCALLRRIAPRVIPRTIRAPSIVRTPLSSSFISIRRFASVAPGPAPDFILRAGEKHTVDVAVSEDPATGRYAQKAVTRGVHTTVIDELGVLGGGDLGPSPYDLMCQALGGCTAMTLRMYAERRGMAVPPLTITLLHSKKNASEIAECPPETTGLVDLFEVTIDTATAADAASVTTEARAKLLEIAGKCPVHKTLAGSPKTFLRTRWQA